MLIILGPEAARERVLVLEDAVLLGSPVKRKFMNFILFLLRLLPIHGLLFEEILECVFSVLKLLEVATTALQFNVAALLNLRV